MRFLNIHLLVLRLLCAAATLGLLASAHAADQCNTTAQCKSIYGSTATDCLNSHSTTSICMCANKRCDSIVFSSSSSSSSSSTATVSSSSSSKPVASSSSSKSSSSSSKSSSSSASITGRRYAITSDGNARDPDDICATPVALGLLYKSGLASQVTHYTLNDHVWHDKYYLPKQAAAHTLSYTGTISRTNNAFTAIHKFDAYEDKLAAVTALKNEINKSTKASPLTIMMAGRAQVLGEALLASNKSARPFVTVISHSPNNENWAESYPGGIKWSQVTSSGAIVKRIAGQNTLTKKPYKEYDALRTSSDPLLNWIWDRCNVMNVDAFDPSDAGMTYYALTGDEKANPKKLVNYLKRPAP